MLVNGILNPQINSLLARVRHTNMLVIADRGFPYWPMIETVDISLVDDIPTVLQVFKAISLNFYMSEIVMAQEFLDDNSPEICENFAQAAAATPLTYEPHIELKKRIPWVNTHGRYHSICQYDSDLWLVSVGKRIDIILNDCVDSAIILGFARISIPGC